MAKKPTYKELEKKIKQLERNSARCHRDLKELLKIAEDEKSKFETQLQQAQKIGTVGTLAGGIAHEFNNILWIITSNAELALANIPKGNPARYHLELIEDACQRAKDFVGQIISFSRESGHVPEPLKIGIVVREFVKFLRSSIPATIKISHHISSESDTVMANLFQVNQLLMNLCSNAAYAMKEKGGDLEISLIDVELDEDEATLTHDLSPGKYVILSVRDTGHGIDVEKIDHIFDAAYSTKEGAEFAGMGLAVSREIVMNHGGDITVHSEPGKGTIFHIFLPCMDIADNDQRAEKDEEIPTGSEEILFVDDEKVILNACQKMLTQLGYKVTLSANGVEALELFRSAKKRFDLVITDFTMPNMTGMELAQKLMRIRPDIPIILCTGFNALVTPEKARKLGIREFIMKPVKLQKMAQIIRSALDDDLGKKKNNRAKSV
ncbi:MAG: response regulator [Deltaproteobacteria bacterium]|nr:response regulator [Deltaproteobacteria bacterium]